MTKSDALTMKKKFDNTSYIKLFIIVVLFAAFISISYKAFLLVKNRSFRFSTYNIMLVGRDAHLMGFNTQNKQTHVLEFNNARERFSGNNILVSSTNAGVPLDGIVISIKPQNLTDSKTDFPSFRQTLSLILEDEKYVFYNVNKFDLIKLYIISKLTSWDDKSYVNVKNIAQDFLREKFYDSEIFNEKTSVEVVNSTGIDGLGARIGFILANIGANVVSIKDGEDEKTQVLTKDLNLKTLKRVERLFELEAQKDESTGIADIIINLGKDIVGRLR